MTTEMKDGGAFRITWMDAEGNAACIGLDETVICDSAESAERDARYHGEIQGVDVERYRPEAEFIGWLDDAAE